MTYEEEGVFMIVFLKGTASADTIMDEAEMSKEETTEGINGLVKKGLLVMADDGIKYAANEYGDCIAVWRSPPLWGLTPAAKKTALYNVMVESQARFQKLIETDLKRKENKDEKTP